MATMTKPITRFVTLDKPFDIAAVFAKRKRKPTGVTIVMIPNYEEQEDTDPDRTVETPKNKKAYQESLKNRRSGEYSDIEDLKKKFFALHHVS